MDNINDILGLHFSNEKLSCEQEEILMSWIENNQEEYEKLAKMIDYSEAISLQDSTFDTEKAWAKISPQLHVHHDSSATKIAPRSENIFNIKKVIAYAACLVLLISFSVFLFRPKNDYLIYANGTNKLMKVNLPDSSSVVLYPSAEIKYLAKGKTLDKTTPERKVILDGKAFFKVKPNHDRPFIVENNDVKIKVLGTSFLVSDLSSDSDSASNTTSGSGLSSALASSLKTKVYVKEGIVQVTTSEESIRLIANEKANVNGEKIQKNEIEHPEIIFKNHIKKMVYKDASLEKVIKEIEDEFNVKILTENIDLSNKITTKLEFIDIESILEELSYICNCTHKKVSDKTYLVYNDKV